MATRLIPPTDTRSFFRPVANQLVDLLRGLPADAWDRPTSAGSWRVRDVVAHLIDTSIRRVSFQRDRHTPPASPRPGSSEEEFVRFINAQNAEWVTASKRISGTMLTRLYSVVGVELAEFFEQCAFDAPALFPVSWAEKMATPGGWTSAGS